MAGHHHAHVFHFKVIALQHYGDDVFANIVYIAFDGGNHDFAFAAHICARGGKRGFFGLDIGQQMRHSQLHNAGRFDHLRQKHFARTKQIAHHIHAVH